MTTDRASFSVQEGKVFGLPGPSSAGKATLISMLTGIAAPTSGTARLAGHDLRKVHLEQREHVGLQGLGRCAR
ncbi:MAG TPA: ATP-binding cassette domain-containing protein [Armatimonadota bacterium]|nr:ATP-binding cassette domain-containing protein [Armatimonadota bacterium]